jgi:hypothetical protein
MINHKIKREASRLQAHQKETRSIHQVSCLNRQFFMAKFIVVELSPSRKEKEKGEML